MDIEEILADFAEFREVSVEELRTKKLDSESDLEDLFYFVIPYLGAEYKIIDTSPNEDKFPFIGADKVDYSEVSYSLVRMISSKRMSDLDIYEERALSCNIFYQGVFYLIAEGPEPELKGDSGIVEDILKKIKEVYDKFEAYCKEKYPDGTPYEKQLEKEKAYLGPLPKD